jgi:hypothetical protein
MAQTAEDSVWLSQDPSGYPRLDGLQTTSGTPETISVFFRTGDSLGAVVVPLDLETTDGLTLDTLFVDRTVFPSTWPDTTSLFIDVENDTIVSAEQKVVFAVIRLQNPAPIAPGVYHMATMVLSTSQDADLMVDSTLWDPSSNMTFCNKEGTLEWNPEWNPVYRCGDTNGDNNLSTADGFTILNYLGSSGNVSSHWSANVNGDQSLSSADGFWLLNFFGGGFILNCAPVSELSERGHPAQRSDSPRDTE